MNGYVVAKLPAKLNLSTRLLNTERSECDFLVRRHLGTFFLFYFFPQREKAAAIEAVNGSQAEHPLRVTESAVQGTFISLKHNLRNSTVLTLELQGHIK